jgi:hypothetical protein
MDDARNFKLHRRGLLGAAAAMIASARFDMIGRAQAQASGAKQPDAPSFGPLKQIDARGLNIGFAESGPASGPPVLLLHGWPYDIHSFVEVAPILAATGFRVIVLICAATERRAFFRARRQETVSNRLWPPMRSRSWTRSRSRRPFSAALIGARGLRTSSRRSGRSAAMASSR